MQYLTHPTNPTLQLRNRIARGDWVRVAHAMSGASVWRVSGSPDVYVKLVPRPSATLTHELAREAERADWLRRHGVPAARVVELGGNADESWLVTVALPGVPASEPWPQDQRGRVIEAIADVARTLHELPVESCPFDRSLAVTMALARQAVDDATINLDQLDEERVGWSGSRLWSELVASRPETEDLVVCHGDLCLPNILLDPHDASVTGVIDVGRLGTADRYQDLALATRSISSQSLNPQFGGYYAQRFLTAYGEHDPDAARVRFYRLLDEFF